MLQPDEHLGIYRLISRIGAGGMGEVWKAEDTRLGRTVAIKILPAAVASDPEAIARMRREARTAAQLNHPNIAMIHAFEEAGDRLFIVMEYVDGETLTQLIQRGPLPEGEVCRIGKSVAEALGEAHAKGIVHRDVKPDNIVVNGPRVKVLDFGIAKQMETQSIRAQDPTAFLTQQGYILGTVHYMSPEQALGKSLDARTDIFSLGVVLYQAVTGTLPFRGESATETITQIVRDEPRTPRGISPGLTSIIRRCLQKNREERFGSAAELAQALDEQMGVAPTVYTGSRLQTVKETVRMAASPTRRRWPWIAAIVAVVMVAGIAAMLVKRPARVEAAPPANTVATTARVAPPSPAAAPPSTTTVEVMATTTTAAPAPAPAPAQPVRTPPPAPSADQLYDEGMMHLLDRQHSAARASFVAAIEADPHHARSHFRLAEMALFTRQNEEARQELNAALADADRLESRQRTLAELALAHLDHDRVRAQQLLRELSEVSPNDPDLRRFRELIGAEREDRPRPVFRPRRRP